MKGLIKKSLMIKKYIESKHSTKAHNPPTWCICVYNSNFGNHELEQEFVL